MATTETWQQKAQKRWQRAEWISGSGPFALLAHCGLLTVTLWETQEEAEEQKRMIDQIGCGGECFRHHEIVTLQEQEEA